MLVMQYGEGQIIMNEGDLGRPVCFVLEGRVRAYRTNLDGRQQTLTYLTPGSGFNLPAAFSTSHRSPASVEAAGPVKLLIVSQEDFRNITSETPSLALAVLGDLSDRLEYFSDLVHDVSLRSVRSRLARFLLEQSHSTTHPNWTQEEIAMQIGTSREVVSRSLRALIQEGMLKTLRQRIVIVDEEALRAEAEL
jgi:CRP-like cAMP-binding protein